MKFTGLAVKLLNVILIGPGCHDIYHYVGSMLESINKNRIYVYRQSQKQDWGHTNMDMYNRNEHSEHSGVWAMFSDAFCGAELCMHIL